MTRHWQILSVLPVFFLACLCFMAGTSAGNSASITVTPDAVLVAQGETFSIDLTIDPPAATTASWVVEVGYDPAVLQYKSCRALDPLPGAVQASDCDSSSDHSVKAQGAALYSRDGKHGLKTVTRVVTFKFTAIGSLGTHTALTISVQLMADPDGQSQPSNTHDGSVWIIVAVVGDTNCDGDADVEDVTGILRKLSGVRPEPACWDSADVNHDDHVDALDVLMILKQFAGIA